MTAENIFSHNDGVYQIDGGFLSLALGWYPLTIMPEPAWPSGN